MYITPLLTLVRGHSFCPLLMSMSEAFSLLYFNKTLLHKSSERSSLISGPDLNSSPWRSRILVFHGSATAFHGFFSRSLNYNQFLSLSIVIFRLSVLCPLTCLHQFFSPQSVLSNNKMLHALFELLLSQPWNHPFF